MTQDVSDRSPEDRAEIKQLAKKDRFREKFDGAAGKLREALVNRSEGIQALNTFFMEIDEAEKELP